MPLVITNGENVFIDDAQAKTWGVESVTGYVFKPKRTLQAIFGGVGCPQREPSVTGEHEIEIERRR